MTVDSRFVQELIQRCSDFRNAKEKERTLRDEFFSHLRRIFPSPEDQKWIDHYDPKVGKNPMTRRPAGPVTWTLKSRHMSGRAADVAHPTKAWGVGANYKKALKKAAIAEGCHIGPPATDWAHVEY